MHLPDGRIRKLRRSAEDPGCVHELTFSCYRRLPLLSRDRTRRWLVAALAAARRQHGLELWAYVIMPEHVHLLFAPLKADYRVRSVLQSIKQPVARQALDYLRQTAPVWLENLRAGGRQAAAPARRAMSQLHGLASLDRATSRDARATYHFWQPGGGYDRTVDRATTVRAIVDYIHENPVRRGLVERSTDWLWSSARWYAGESDVVLPMDAVPPAQWR